MRPAAVVVFSLTLLTGLLLPGAEKPAPPWEKNNKLGRALYRENCSVCHEINKKETKKMGPTMFRFFQNEESPLPDKEREQYFRIRVQFGGDIMPAFRTTLSARQLDLIVAYVRSKKE